MIVFPLFLNVHMYRLVGVPYKFVGFTSILVSKEGLGSCTLDPSSKLFSFSTLDPETEKIQFEYFMSHLLRGFECSMDRKLSSYLICNNGMITWCMKTDCVLR